LENLKKLNSLFKNLKYKIKEKISKLEINNINLRQSNFFIRSLTWGLISTSGLTITWLAFAYTEEIIIVRGKLEPIGDVKIINIPSGGVVKDILVKNGEEVFKDQILLVLDNEILRENVISIENQIKQKKSQLELKQEEKVKLVDLYNSKLRFLRNEFSLQDNIKNRFKELYEEGALSELDYLEKISEINSLEGEIVENDINLKRQSLILSQQIKQIESELSELEEIGQFINDEKEGVWIEDISYKRYIIRLYKNGVNKNISRKEIDEIKKTSDEYKKLLKELDIPFEIKNLWKKPKNIITKPVN